MEFKKIIDEWELSQPEKIASTHTSDVYKVIRKSKSLVLKVLNDKGQIYEKDGYIALDAFSGNGAIKLINRTGRFQLLEFVDGQKLSATVKEGKDQQANKVISKVLLMLHSSKIPSQTELPNLERQFKSLIDRGKSEPSGTILYKTLKVAEELISNEKSIVLLHGDIHHDNILYSSSRGWLAIDPQPLIGEKSYDFANCFFNPDDCPSVVEKAQRIVEMAKVFSSLSDIDPNRLLKFAFAHGGLSMSWQLDEGESPGRRLRITQLLENLLKL